MNYSIEIRYIRDDGKKTNELIQVPFYPAPGDLLRLNGAEYEVTGRMIDVDFSRSAFYLERIRPHDQQENIQ